MFESYFTVSSLADELFRSLVQTTTFGSLLVKALKNVFSLDCLLHRLSCYKKWDILEVMICGAALSDATQCRVYCT